MEKKREETSRPDAEFNDPDRDNSEQNEDGMQAQDVAEEALHGDDFVIADSVPGSPDNPADLVPRDVPDLVDNLKGMLNSGRIDMGAFEGEENMDDEDEEE